MDLKKLPRKLIGEILIEEGYIESAELEQALEAQKREGGLLGEILVRQGSLTEEQLVMGLSKQLSVPFILLSHYNINRSAAKLIPREVAERYLVCAFDQDERKIFLAMMDPANALALGEVQKRIPLSMQIYLSTPSEIRKAIGMTYVE